MSEILIIFRNSTKDIVLDLVEIIKKFTHNYKSPYRTWVGPELFINVWKPHQLEIILNHTHTLEKAKLYRLTKLLVGNSLFVADVPAWKRHRKVIMPSFNQNILNNFVQVFAEQAEILSKQLQKKSGKEEFDIYDYVSKCTLDTFCETSMGVTINAQTTDCDYMNWTNRLLEIAGTYLMCSWFLNDFVLKLARCLLIGREAFDLLDKIRNFTAAVIKEKQTTYQKEVTENKGKPQSQNINKRKTFLDQLIEVSEKTGARFTDIELREEVDTFMIAGSDTTATVVSAAFVMLAMFPEVQNKVYGEVLEVLGPDKPVDWTDLGKFEYLEMVLKETLRLFPITVAVARSVSEDVELDNCILPAGSTASILLLPLHRDPEIWPDPLKFDPNRFLPEEIANRHPYSWLPFSGGLRSCVGPKYAMMSMKAMIATVIRKYKLSTTYKNIEDIKLQFRLLLKPVHGYKISVELRNSA